VPSYARFDLVLERGEGSYVWDIDGGRYLDLAGGIAVCSLGHAHPEITKALTEQSRKLIHVSNLYYNELQGRLAKRIVDLIAPGRVFFCNSGAEANEGLFKLARKFGHDDGRYEIITTVDSFHGRTLAGIAATGQEKVKKGFEPAVGGFPTGAFWVRDKFADVLSAGTHASTFGGTPLACAVALKIFDVIECENLAGNARDMGDFLLCELQKVQQRFPKVVKIVRGLGLMIGIEFQPQFKAVEIVKELHQRNL